MRAIRTLAMLVVLGTAGPTLGFAQENAPPTTEPAASSATEPSATEPPSQPRPEAQPLPVPQAGQPASPSPALNVSQPTVQNDKEPLVEKWWFWSAVGAVVVGTVVAIVLIDGGSSTPRTTLGNQEFRP